MPPIDARIWKIREDDKETHIELYRKYEYGLRDSIAVIILLTAAMLVTSIILIFTAGFPYVLISFLLFFLIIILLVILAFKIVAHSEVQQITITASHIKIEKKSMTRAATRSLPRDLVTHLKMPGVNYSTEAVVVDYFVFPYGLMFPEAFGDNTSPAFYMGNAPIHFFEFGTKAQKMWVMKYIHRKLFAT